MEPQTNAPGKQPRGRETEPQQAPSEAASGEQASGNPADVLRPFQDASTRYFLAYTSAQEAATKQQALASLDIQGELRQAEQGAYQAVMEATKKRLDRLGQPLTGSLDEVYSSRAQAQVDYEREVTQIYTDTTAKLNAIAQKAFSTSAADAATQFATKRQEAYQAYLTELQQAWLSTKNLDPQLVSAIASSILFTINSVR